MALTIVDRPTGYNLGTSFLATVSNDSGGALFTKASVHGLSTGGFVYIVSNIRDYTGFWYITATTAVAIKIRAYATATDVSYINNDTVTIYPYTTAHAYSAVHLPIVYKITSNLWPTNSVDPPQIVSSSSNSFGYTKLNLAGDIKTTGTAAELDFVLLAVNGVNGIYQIIQYISDTQFVIDLTFLGTNVFGNCQFYYNNYHARIKIYAGLTGTHKWAGQKPYVLITELKMVPDSSNLIAVNINEYLKSQIEILTNDLLLGTLPNDINSFCQFYITVAESYDISLDGYTIGSYLSSYADDSAAFQGIAVNAKLPFKNRYSGFMSDYVGSSRKFLTLFDQPTMFNGYWFEIGLIVSNDVLSSMTLVQQTYKVGVLQTSYETLIPNTANNNGVYRMSLSVKGTEDQQYVFIVNTGTVPPYTAKFSETKIINVNQDCSPQALQFQWLNYLGGYDQFVFLTMKDYGIDIPSSKESQKSIMGNWPASYGENADTINREIERESNQSITVYSQNLTETEVDGIVYIKTSPLVQILISKYDKRTVIIDKSSFVKKKDGDKTYYITFKASYTDNVPSQSL